jgi:aspartyl/asparaginyl-tRNA synthetase
MLRRAASRVCQAGESDGEPKLRERLRTVVDHDFARCSYTEAVEIVKKVSGPREGVAWEYPPAWGEELQTEHEKYLAEVVYKKPVIVYNYPKGAREQPLQRASERACSAPLMRTRTLFSRDSLRRMRRTLCAAPR